MTIIKPARVFLDSCILKRLARGEWAKENAELRRRIGEGRTVIVVTADHISDYGDCPSNPRAMCEAYFVDTLHPLWMLHGLGIYLREAYSEYLRLTGRQILPAPFPTRTGSEALLQLARDCPCLPNLRKFSEDLAKQDNDPSFSGKLRGGFQGDCLGLFPGLQQRRERKEQYAILRATVRDRNLVDENCDDVFRRTWMCILTEPPADPPGEDLSELAPRIDFARMPAWAVWMGVRKVWLKNRTAPKSSDLVDNWHLALLPYVDAFITEKNLAEMIRQANVSEGNFVSSRFDRWIQETC